MSTPRSATLIALVLALWFSGTPLLFAQDPQETPENGTGNPLADDADNHDESEGDEDEEDSEGDPIDVSSGAFRYSKTVLSRPGRGMDFNFDLKYLSSAWTVETNTAARWTHNFDQKIVLHVTKGPEITPYPGPIGKAGGIVQQQQGSSGKGRRGAARVVQGGVEGGLEGGLGGTGTGQGPLYPLYFKIFHYHNLRIDRYTKTPGNSALWQGAGGTFKKMRLTWPGGIGQIYRIPDTMTIRGADGTTAIFDLREGGDCYGLPYFQGSTSTFVYRPSKIIDRHGNTFHLNYSLITRPSECFQVWPWSSYRRVSSIVDTMGETTTLGYDADGWLETITGPTGRTVTLEHDTIGNLTAFTVPPITTEPSRWELEYSDKVVGSPNSGHNIEKIIAPNEVNDGTKTPYVENIYDDSLEFRVVRQIYGGTNGSGIPAGGTRDFIYEFQPQFPTQQLLQHAWFGEKSRTLSIDPNGNVRLKIYDGSDRLRLIYQFTGRMNHLADPLNPPAIQSIVSYDVGWPVATGPHASGQLIAPDEAAIGSFTPAIGAFVTRRDYDGNNLMSREVTPDDITEFQYGSSSSDRFQRGNLMLIRRVSNLDPSDVLVQAFSYEPYYNQRWIDYNPRGFSGDTPANGGVATPERFATTHIFDFQENGGPAGLVGPWQIDTAQSLQISTLTNLGVTNPGTVPLSMGDQNGDTLTNQVVGNVIAVYSTAEVYADATQPSAGFTTQTIRSERRFNDYSNLTHIIDPNGNVTERRYFPTWDPFGLGGTTPTTDNSGFLAEVRAPEAVQRFYGYDALGRQTSSTDGRGFQTTRVYDDQNHIVSKTDALGETTNWFYDANGNVTSRTRDYHAPELDANGVPTGNRTIEGVLSESWTYDILGMEVAYTRASDVSGATKTREYRYDRNCNQVATFDEMWSPGSGHLETVVYDELDRVYTQTDGGVTDQFVALAANVDIIDKLNLAPTGQELTRTSFYEDGERVTTRDARGFDTTYIYDGFSRLATMRDPLGNETRRQRDAADNVIEISQNGDDGAGNFVLLAHRTISLDERGRVFAVDVDHFDSSGPVGDGFSTSRTLYDPASNVTMVVDDLGAATNFQYDDLNRQTLRTDALGNAVATVYDDNNNPIRTTSIERHAGGAAESFVTYSFYDKLNRLVAQTRPGGETSRYGYDTMGKTRYHSDAKSAALNVSIASLDTFGEHTGLTGTTNGPGNSVTRTFDFDGRELTRKFSLRANGTGSGNQTSVVNNRRTYDLEGRIETRTDGRNNTTQYFYDDLGRPTLKTYADGTSEAFVAYDENNNLLAKIDARGNVIVDTYDSDNRLKDRAITKAPTVLGSGFESFEYDGLDRIVTAINFDATVWRTFDSLSNVVTEEIGVGNGAVSGPISTFDYDGNGSMIAIHYPGGRTVDITRDALNRPKHYSDQLGDIADYSYFGPSRVERRDDLLAGSEWTLTYDSARRVSTSQHSWSSNGQIFDSRTFDWDRAGNMTGRTDLLQSVTVSYEYDSIDRMIDSQRNSATATHYNLDKVGNRLSVSMGMLAAIYQMTGNDLPVNQYTLTPSGSRTYHDSGSLKTVSGNQGGTLYYDYKNRMIGFLHANSGDATVFAYDVFGRRISKTKNFLTTPSSTYFCYSPATQVLEELDEQGTTLATYVYGRYVDEVISTRRYFGGPTTDIGYHSDPGYNVVKLSTNGVITGNYDYGDYGQILNGATGAAIAPSPDNPYYFSGRRYDPETKYYFYRSRYLDPKIGRFVTRDRIGMWGDESNLGNGLSYVGNNPWSRLDPTGEHDWHQLTGKANYLGKNALPIGEMAGGAVVVTTSVAGGVTASAASGGTLAPAAGVVMSGGIATGGAAIVHGASNFNTPTMHDAKTAVGLTNAVTGTPDQPGAIDNAQSAIDATGGNGQTNSGGQKTTVTTNADGSVTVTKANGSTATKTTDENGNVSWEGESSSGDTWSQDSEGNTTITTADGTVIRKSADGKTVTVEESGKNGAEGRVELDENGNIKDADFREHERCRKCCKACKLEKENKDLKPPPAKATESESGNSEDNRGSTSPNGAGD